MTWLCHIQIVNGIKMVDNTNVKWGKKWRIDLFWSLLGVLRLPRSSHEQQLFNLRSKCAEFKNFNWADRLMDKTHWLTILCMCQDFPIPNMYLPSGSIEV